MAKLRFSKAVYSLLIASFLILPGITHASWLSAPTNLSISGGAYTNDTTPTFTWDRPANATWYEYEIDNGSWLSLGNVGTVTTWNLSSGWHTFFVRAHDNAGNISTTTPLTFEIDTVGPTVPAVSPSTAQTNVSTTFTVSPSGEATATSCALYVDGVRKSSMTKYSSTFSAPYTFSWSGTYTVYAVCTDGDGNSTTGTSRTVTVSGSNTVDTFSVPAVSPSTATEDVSVTMSVTPYGTLDAVRCELYVDGSYAGDMNQSSSNTFTKNYTFNNEGTYSVYAWCKDENGTWVKGSTRTVTVSDSDTNSTLSVPSVSPSSATEDESAHFTVQPSSNYDITICWLYVDGNNVDTMDEDYTNYFTADYTFRDNGSYSVYARCTDSSGKTVNGTSRTVTVNDQDDDNSTLSVPSVSPSSATEDESTHFTVQPSSNYNVTDCWLYVSGSEVETMDEDSTNYFTADYTFTNDGSYTVYARCTDSSGKTVNGTSRTVTVSNQSSNSSSLSVPSVSPSSATEDHSTEFSVQPSSNYNVSSCWLYVDGDNVATMHEDYTNYFTVDYTFHDNGSYSVYARCSDSSGTYVTGTKRTVTVYSSGPSNEANEGDLIKIACGSHPSADDICKAVYYYGDDGKRHAFPNESVYYTWYNNFDDVIEISSSDMSYITIGSNVTYRPGSVLVQFSSGTSIYAIEKKHTLRKYTSTSLLRTDYGSNYEDVIVTVPDTLYGNYTIGAEIDSSSDYDRTMQYYSVDSIDDVL